MSSQLSPIAERRSVSLDDSTRENNGERPAKSRRIRLACLRCQNRKIKCDGSVPKCSNCQKAGTECADGKTIAQDGAISRSEAASLHDQIQKLEEILRVRCPDINVADVTNGSGLGSSVTNVSSDVYARSVYASGIRNPHTNDVQSQGVLTANANKVASLIQANSSRTQDSRDVAHEIGLIPLSAGVNKYVGPSSGFSFAKILFARADQAGTSPGSSDTINGSINQESPSTTRSRSTFTIRPTTIPASLDQALQLSRIYFEHVQIQYPFLHEPSHRVLIREVYRDGDGASRIACFQVTMVLAISAIILSKRLRIPYTGEGLCAAAMEHVSKIDFQNSIQGVQCLLLISMFTLHSSYLGVSPWYLSYQGLAAVLDLGLQRDVPVSATVTFFEREMRTRIFWVIYSLDRILATTLGRPIGLRDEGCDLRLPAQVEDQDLNDAGSSTNAVPGPIACSIYLFQLAQLNSEIKYILHSVTRNTPRYTYPQITDIQAWQQDLWQRLQKLHDEIPKFGTEDKHLSSICLIRYHEIAMLLFRPTPRIRTPAKESLQQCRQSAQETIRLWKSLYETDRMSYSWITIHSVCLSTVTLLYSIWTVPEAAATTKIDVLTSTMRDSSNLLSAAGEHWTEARRSRNQLDDLASATVRWLLDARSGKRSPETAPTTSRRRKASAQRQLSTSANTSPVTTMNNINNSSGFSPTGLPFQTLSQQLQPSQQRPSHQQRTMSQSSSHLQVTDSTNDMTGIPGIDSYINWEDLASLVGAPDSFTNNFTDTMEGMFSEYQPLFDFNLEGDASSSFQI